MATPAQPNQPTYSATMLNLFPPDYNRDSYLKAFGKEAPAFDPSRPVKLWLDPTVDMSDPSVPVTYTVVQLTAKDPGGWRPWVIVLTAGEAGSVNLPPRGPVTDPVIQAALAQPAVPDPIRALLPNEKRMLFAGMQVAYIERTDMGGNPQPGDGFTAADRSLLQAIAAKLSAV